ncbi:MAG: hypothetical protein ACLP3Q_05305 [Streptosporangiaceae bacterium]
MPQSLEVLSDSAVTRAAELRAGGDTTAQCVPYTARERRATAHHEAGHVLACLVLGLPFKYVTIERGADNDPESSSYGQMYDGRIRYNFGHINNAEVLKTWTREQKLAHATQYLCGALAEDYDQRYRHRQIDPCEGAEDDLMWASRLIRWIHVHPLDEATKAQRDAATADFNVAFDRAEALVKDNFRKIRKVALGLQERNTLMFDEVVTLLEEVPMPRSRYEKSIDARHEAVDRFVKIMTNKSAVDADRDGVPFNCQLDELALAHINMCFEQHH